jgi:hypothetical protein
MLTRKLSFPLILAATLLLPACSMSGYGVTSHENSAPSVNEMGSARKADTTFPSGARNTSPN